MFIRAVALRNPGARAMKAFTWEFQGFGLLVGWAAGAGFSMRGFSAPGHFANLAISDLRPLRPGDHAVRQGFPVISLDLSISWTCS